MTVIQFSHSGPSESATASMKIEESLTVELMTMVYETRKNSSKWVITDKSLRQHSTRYTYAWQIILDRNVSWQQIALVLKTELTATRRTRTTKHKKNQPYKLTVVKQKACKNAKPKLNSVVRTAGIGALCRGTQYSTGQFWYFFS